MTLSNVDKLVDPHTDWKREAKANIDEWGIQHPEEVLSAIGEEFGELEQAYLEATHEDEGWERVIEELDDLGPLLLQLLVSVVEHPDAFEPLPTAEQIDRDGDPS